MIESLDREIIGNLRTLAMKNTSVPHMMGYLIEKLGLKKDSRILVIAYFREAFFLEIAETKPIGAWDFFEGGTWSNVQIENEFRPLIQEQRWEKH